MAKGSSLKIISVIVVLIAVIFLYLGEASYRLPGLIAASLGCLVLVMGIWQRRKDPAVTAMAADFATRMAAIETEMSTLLKAFQCLASRARGGLGAAGQCADAHTMIEALSTLESATLDHGAATLLGNVQALPTEFQTSQGMADVWEGICDSTTLLPFAHAVLASVPTKTEEATFVLLEKFETVRSISSRAAGIAHEAHLIVEGDNVGTDLAAKASLSREAVMAERKAVGEIASHSRKNAKDLGELSVEIESGIELLHGIEEISDHSRLIAFNLAVEAAHFGDKGRGFKVIAGELRSLNDRTADFSRRITELLMHFKEYNTKLIKEMAIESERLIGDVEKGMDSAESAVESFIGTAASTDRFARGISALAIEIDRNLDHILESLQFQDITRQMIEGALVTLGELKTNIGQTKDFLHSRGANMNIDTSRIELLRNRLLARSKTKDEKSAILEVKI